MKKINRFVSAITIMCMLLTLFTFSVSAADDTFTLEVTVPAAYASGTVSLYVGAVAYRSTAGTLTAATSTATQDDGSVVYTYEGISSARTMHLVTAGEGFVSKKRTYYFGNIENVIGSTQSVTAEFYDYPGKGWHQAPVVTYTHAMDEYMSVPDTQVAQDAYTKYVAPTPYFQRMATNPLQMSTQNEQIEFIESLDETDDNLYFFENFQRSYNSANYYMNLVLFTKTEIPSGATMDDAAALVTANGKPTILYKGQIHGNEPAPGEATLAMIKALDSDYGETLLDSVNVLVIPRVAPYTAYTFGRNVNSPNGSVNPNRDCMRSITNEVTGTHKVFYKFWPEIVIDAHEYTTHSSSSTTQRCFPDICYTLGSTLNASPDMLALGTEFVKEVRDVSTAAGFNPYIYDDLADNRTVARYSAKKTVYNHPFYSQLGCVSFLIESPGGCSNSTGDDWIERRVTGHFISTKSIFDYAAENAATLKATVAEAREKIVSDGATYNEDDLFVLEHGSNESAESALTFKAVIYDIRTGEVVEDATKDHLLYPSDKAVRTRVRPTAYFIPKEGAWIENDNLENVSEANRKPQYQRALDTLDKHSVKYYEIPAGSTISLLQYTGTKTSADLTEERLATFENGGYVVPMNQKAGNVIGGLFEPDVTDNSGDPGTFMQQGLYYASDDGTMPVYRYIKDLSTTDLTYGGVLLSENNTPEGLTAVHKTTTTGTGSITGLNPSKSYEYAPSGGSYMPVRAGETKISGLEPGTYYVRYSATETESFSADAVIVVEDNYTGPVLERYNAEMFENTPYAMPGSKVLFKAVENAVYYRNGVEITDYETLTSADSVALVGLPVAEGFNNFSASQNGVDVGTISVYGAQVEKNSDDALGSSLHAQIDSGVTTYTTASPHPEISNLIDSDHTVAYQSAAGNITSNLKTTSTATYSQIQLGMGFYIDGALEDTFKPVALTATSGTYCKFTPTIEAGGRLYVDTLGSGKIDTGITITSDEWHDLAIFSDFYNSGYTELYIDGTLVAMGKIYKSFFATEYANLGDGPSNCYIGDAVSCVSVAKNNWPQPISTTASTKMFSTRTSKVKLYPAISIEAGSAESSVKVTVSDMSTFTDYSVKLFVNNEMIDTEVKTDGSDTAISVVTTADLTDSLVYAAIVDAKGNIFNGFSGELKTDEISVDVKTTVPEADGIVSGTIASGKLLVNREEFPEAVKTDAAHIIEVKADDSLNVNIMEAAETIKEVSVSTTSKKVFLWILDKLYPLCAPVVE